MYLDSQDKMQQEQKSQNNPSLLEKARPLQELITFRSLHSVCHTPVEAYQTECRDVFSLTLADMLVFVLPIFLNLGWA